MTAEPVPRPGWELLAGQVNQRRYDALRAYLFEGASLQQAADATRVRAMIYCKLGLLDNLLTTGVSGREIRNCD